MKVSFPIGPYCLEGSGTAKTTMLADSFSQLKSNLELTPYFDDLVQQRHNAVRAYLKNNDSNIVDTKLIGSVRRKTRIQPAGNAKFDIDILVVMGSFYNWLPPGAPGGVTPEQALNTLHRSVQSSERYGAMNLQQSSPIVSVTYGDETVVEFVPAYVDQIGASSDGTVHNPKGRAYWIPKNGKWELADYDYESEYISRQNTASDGWLIPTIKMLKAIKREYFSQMRSFQLDIIASLIIPTSVSVRKQHNVEISYPMLIKDFFTYAPLHLASPTRVPGSHSPAITLNQENITALTGIFQKVDAYIGSLNSLPQGSKQTEGWKLLFGTPFPIT